MKISPFKVQVQVGGQVRWADADKVFAHLMDRYIKRQQKLQDNFEKRLEKFSEGIDEFKGKYSSVILEEFEAYWTEPNKSGTKMRFELEKTWSLSRRLKTWKRRAVGTNHSEPILYDKYVPPVINEDDVASPDEIKEILRRK